MFKPAALAIPLLLSSMACVEYSNIEPLFENTSPVVDNGFDGPPPRENQESVEGAIAGQVGPTLIERSDEVLLSYASDEFFTDLFFVATEANTQESVAILAFWEGAPLAAGDELRMAGEPDDEGPFAMARACAMGDIGTVFAYDEPVDEIVISAEGDDEGGLVLSFEMTTPGGGSSSGFMRIR